MVLLKNYLIRFRGTYMILDRNILIDQIIQKELVENTNPILRQDLLKKSIEEEKENFIQEQVKTIFKDRKYYKHFQEAVVPNQQVQPQKPQVEPVTAEQTQAAAKAKAIQSQMVNVKQQQLDRNLTPEKKKSLDQKKVELQAALEKLRIDSEERVANNRISSDERHGTKRAILGNLSSGIGSGVGMGLIGAAGMGIAKLAKAAF
jgi:hypothetical protein